MSPFDVLKQESHITFHFENKDPRIAQIMCHVVSQRFPGMGVFCFVDNGYLMIYLIYPNPTFVPICETAKIIVRNNIAKTIRCSRTMNVAAPKKEELEDIKRIIGHEIDPAFDLPF